MPPGNSTRPESWPNGSSRIDDVLRLPGGQPVADDAARSDTAPVATIVKLLAETSTKRNVPSGSANCTHGPAQSEEGTPVSSSFAPAATDPSPLSTVPVIVRQPLQRDGDAGRVAVEADLADRRAGVRA